MRRGDMHMHIEFNDDVEPDHRRIDADDWDDIYVIGDVHGCRETLDRLLDRLEPTTNDLVLFVGDLVRKGPDSRGVVDLVRERQNFLSVRGNNEQKLLDGRKRVPSLADDLEFLSSLPVVISWADGLVVHGGIDPRKPLTAHSREELLTMRSQAPAGGYERPFWFEGSHRYRRVFFGHTVLDRPFATDSAVGLDTGCVYGGSLTAFDCISEQFVSVEPPRTYRQRSRDKIVDPRVRRRC